MPVKDPAPEETFASPILTDLKHQKAKLLHEADQLRIQMERLINLADGIDVSICILERALAKLDPQ